MCSCWSCPQAIVRALSHLNSVQTLSYVCSMPPPTQLTGLQQTDGSLFQGYAIQEQQECRSEKASDRWRDGHLDWQLQRLLSGLNCACLSDDQLQCSICLVSQVAFASLHGLSFECGCIGLRTSCCLQGCKCSQTAAFCTTAGCFLHNGWS